MFRVGLGQDSHRFGESKVDKPLVLGGVLISGGPKINEADSDGDVLLHALCNALGQAIGGPSLGVYATPMAKKGTEDSKEYVLHILKQVKEKGYRVNNVGFMIETQRPRLEQYNLVMRKSISSLLGITIDDVGITVTSGKDLTAFGKGEGIQVFAIVSLVKNE